MKPSYLDNAAATPLDPSIAAAMQSIMSETFYNPSAVYEAAKQAKRLLHDARKNVAHWLGANATEIIFTAGATEANNIAIRSVMHGGGNVVVSSIEHESVLEPAQQFEHTVVSVNKDGHVVEEALLAAMDDQTKLVSIIYASNEIGTIQHVSQLSKLIEKIRISREERGVETQLLFHVDASQASQYLDLHVGRLGVDMMTISAAKIYGPKQVGVLYIRSGLVLSPFIYGGGQEKSIRSGTENIAGAHAIALALKHVQSSRKQEVKRVSNLRDMLQSGVLALGEDIQILGHKKFRLPNSCTVLIPGQDGERLVMELDEKGIQCSTGSACAALKDDAASHVIQALGFSAEEASASVRFSLGKHTTETDITRTITALSEILDTKMSTR